MGSLDAIKSDIAALAKEKSCGPIFIRLSWHDAGVFSTGKLTGGCPNAVMRFTDGGEGAFGANAGLPDVALGLLKPITDKYVPTAISNADLWALAANVSIEVMGGPKIPTRFGRTDAASSAESVESQVGRLPDGDKGVDHLREIFHPKGFSDKEIVALSGAHTVGKCHLDRSGFDGEWTEDHLTFDNSYFKEMLAKEYEEETTEKGCPQHRNKETGTMMLISDLALLEEPFRSTVELYANDQEAFFKDFTEAWVKLQELNCTGLRTEL
jgi:catalase (peroxidase I)